MMTLISYYRIFMLNISWVLTQVCKQGFRPHLSHDKPRPLGFSSIAQLYKENQAASIQSSGESDENDQVSTTQLVSEAFPESRC